MTYKISSDGSVAVSTSEAFQSMDTCPLNVKVQVLTAGGIACYAKVTNRDSTDYTGWAPVPATKPAVEQGKLQLTLSATKTYTAYASNYPDCKSLQEMLAQDIGDANGDPFTFLDADDLVWTATGTILKGDK